jgi:hypothetical protein
MGDNVATPSLIVLGWIGVAVMAFAAAMMFAPS